MTVDTNRNLTTEALKLAVGFGRPPDWNAALDLLGKASEAGEDGAERQYELLSQAPIDELLTPPQPESLTSKARVAAARGFAPPGFADWLIDKAKDRLEEATVNNRNGMSELRNAKTCFFPPNASDLVIAVLQERAARLLSVPVAFHEPPSVISYEPGEQFGLHEDFIDPTDEANHDELRIFGQRVGTFVTYLNDGFEGAATEFPALGIAFRGEPGDAIFFANVKADGTPDMLTRHRAPAPQSGRKWVLSQWVRSQPFRFAPQDLPR